MSIKAELFNGTILEFPDNTEQSVIDRVAREETLKLQGAERKAEDVGFIEGIGAAGKRGLASLGEIASGLGLAGTAVTGTEEETRRKMQAIKEQQAQPEAVPGTRFADLERIYQEQGLGAALKEVPKYTAEQIVQNIPQMAGPLAAGAAASPFLTPVGGALVGMGVYGVQQFGNFLVRQAAEKEDPKELEVAKAALTAAGTAPLGYLADRFTVGLGSLGKTAGKEIIQELAKRKGIDLAGGVAKQVGKGVTAGIIAEAPTEVLEQAAERYQAGLKLTGDDAYNEYKEALFGAIAAGGGIKGITTGAEVGLGVRKERREGGPELQVPEGFVPGMPPEAPQTAAGAIEQPAYTPAPIEELMARREARIAQAEQDRLDAIQAEIAASRAAKAGPTAEQVAQQLQAASLEGTGQVSVSPLEEAAAEAQRRQAAVTEATTVQAPEVEVRAAVDTAMRSIEQNNGVATLAQANLLDRYFPGQKMYDRIATPVEEEAIAGEIITPETKAPRETVRMGERVDESQEAWEKLQADREQRQREVLREEPVAEEVVKPAPEAVTEAMQTPAFQQTPEQRLTLQAAQRTYTPSQMEALQTPPFARTAAQKISVQGLTSRVQSNVDSTVDQANAGDQNAKFSIRDAGGEFSPEMQDKANEVRRELVPALQRFGLQGVALKLVDSINNGTADGAYFRNVIQVALDSDKPMLTLRHEVIHALKKTGAFTNEEWALLEKKAREQWINQYFSKDMQQAYLDQYLADNNGNPEGFESYMAEEAIAEAFKNFEQTGKAPAGRIGNIFRRIKEMLGKMREFFQNRGLTTDRIFQGIERGEYAPAYGGAEVAPAYQARPTARPKFSLRDAAAVSNIANAFAKAREGDFNANRELKVFLQDMVKSAAKSEELQRSKDYLVGVGTQDALYALESNANAVGWYDATVKKAMNILSALHPEIATDPDARFAFTWALAVTSNGQKVDKNFELAEQVYNHYKRTGKMPTNLQAGQAQGAINESLALFNDMVAKYGIDDLRKFMSDKFKVSQIERVTGVPVTGEFKDTEVRGAAILGPKIGNGFFSNLNGFFDQLTMDRWLMRTWGRWTGSLISPRPDMVEKKQGELAALIKDIKRRPAVARAFEAAIGTGLDTTNLNALANAIQKASMKPEIREAMNKSPVGEKIRKAGNSLAKYLDGQKEAPAGPEERNFIRSVFGDILQNVRDAGYENMTMSDLQALLWYPEKRLYDIAKSSDVTEGYTDDEAPDYANAAAKLARANGVTEEEIRNAANISTTGIQRGVGVGQAEAGVQAGVSGFAPRERKSFLTQGVVRSYRERNGSTSGAYKRKSGSDGRGIRVLGQNAVAEFSPESKFKNALSIVNLPAPKMYELGPEGAAAFSNAITASKNSTPFGAAVYVYPEEDYANMRLFLSNDGKSGFALKGNDIVSVFSGERGAATAMLQLAIDQGGRKLDAFDTVLPDLYAANGFKVVSRLPWNEEFKPEDWNKKTFAEFNGGMPDVVFMAYDPAHAKPSGGEYAADYDQAVAMQDSALLKEKGKPSAKQTAETKYSLRPEASDVERSKRDREVSAAAGSTVQYGTAQLGSTQVNGVHYSRQPRENLDGRFHGTGLSGAERRRLQFADDPRIKRRINFYVDNGSGILPEVGVGSYPHSVSLNNIYDANERKDLQRLVDPSLKGGDWANAFESEVIKAGYDGYVADFGNQRAAVLLGDHVVPMGESKKYSLRAPTTPEFKEWFKGSQVVNEDGKPMQVYHGTDQEDSDVSEVGGIAVFDESKPIWFAKSPELAEDYARYSGPAAIYPAYLSIKNPFVISQDLNQTIGQSGFTRVLGSIGLRMEDFGLGNSDLSRPVYSVVNDRVFANRLRDLGHDGIFAKERGYDTYAALYNQQVKSSFNQRPNKYESDIRYSLRQAEKLAPIVQRNANFKRWFGNSKIVGTRDRGFVNGEVVMEWKGIPEAQRAEYWRNLEQHEREKMIEDYRNRGVGGGPRIMYHGTSRDITEFSPKQADAIFVTDDPSFAEDFTNLSEDYMAEEYFKSMPLDERQKLINSTIKQIAKDGAITKGAAQNLLEKYKDNPDNAYRSLNQFLAPVLKDKIASRANIMPVYVRAENPFDYENEDHLRQVGMQMAWNAQDRGGEANPIAWADHFVTRAGGGSWEVIETPDVQQAIRDSGFDSFYIMEGGRKNLGVYSPNQVKSAIGNVGTYGDTGDIRYSFNGKKLDRLTKLGDERTAGQKIKEAVTEAHDNFGNRSWRVSWIDVSDSLGKSLSSLPIFDKDGRLRADYLTHTKFQTINLVKNGLVSGIPVVNSDGSVVINRSDNNLARAQLIADQIDTNKFAVEQGMSGRQLVAEVARILRGKDILEEDKQLRAKSEKQLRDATALFKMARQRVEDGTISAKEYRNTLKVVANLRKEGYKNRNINRERLVSDAHIAFAEHIYNSVPEVRQVLDIFREVNHGLVNLWEQAGILTKEQADEYRSNKHYVPFLKSAEDLDESAVQGFGMTGGKGAKSTPKMKKLKGGEHRVNIWENVSKQYAKMTALGIENQTRATAASQLVGLGLAFETNPSDDRTNLRYRRDGKEVHIVAENPLDVAAFQSMNYQLNPVMKYFFGGATKALRWGALVNPMFWLRQLIRDPMHASMTTDAMVTPLHSASNFVGMLFGKDREAVDILSARGVLGEFGTTMNIHDFLETVGKDTGKKRGKIGDAIHKVMQIHEAADAATRVAIYKQAYEKAKKQGYSDERAQDIAVFKARESINFSVQGNSPMLANLRQMIPFLSATITSLDTLYRAMRGLNLSPEDAVAAKRIFWSRAMMMVALSTVYAMMYSGDDDYEEVPDYEKDNNWLIPITSSTDPNKKSFISIPAPFEVGFLFKTLPEVFVRYLTGTSTGKEAVASIQTGLIHNMPTGGVPIPQAVRPALEVITNHSFFTGNPIEGMNDQRKPTHMRGDRASETAKLLSKYGLDTIGLSPANIDHMMRGYFAEYGTLFFNLTDSVIYGINGETPPSKILENEPFIKNFMTDPTVQRSVSVFYDLERQANQTYTEFNEMKKIGNAEEINAILTDPEKRAAVIAQDPLNKIGNAMTKINAEMKRIEDAPNMTADQKRDLINYYKSMKADLARQGVAVAKQVGLTH